MKSARPFAQKEKRMHRRHGKSGRDEGGKGHVQRFVQTGRVEHGRDRVYVDRFSVDHPEAGRRIHPRVRGHDEDTGERAV